MEDIKKALKKATYAALEYAEENPGSGADAACRLVDTYKQVLREYPGSPEDKKPKIAEVQDIIVEIDGTGTVVATYRRLWRHGERFGEAVLRATPFEVIRKR